MSSYKIAVIPGDGTGPEVVAEGIKVLNAVAGPAGLKFDYTYYDLGGERYKRTGETLPESVIAELRQFKAIYLGAIGHPDVAPGILEKGILLNARFALDQYINLRPVILYPGVETPLKDKGPEDIDFAVVRENTEGLYAGAGGFLKYGTPDEVAVQESINTRKGVDRCLKFAFELTRKRNRDRPWRPTPPAFITSAITVIIPSWLTVIVITRDLIILIGFLIFILIDYRPKMKPSLVSKVTTAFQISTILLVLLRDYYPIFNPISVIAIYGAAILTIISGAHYIYLGARMLNGRK